MVGQASCLSFENRCLGQNDRLEACPTKKCRMTGRMPVILGEQSPPMKTPELTTYRRKLPHWRIEDSIYFVTWRLAKNQQGLRPAERTLVVDAIKHFDGLRYDLLAYVVMDDHVHVLACPLANHSLQQIVHSWKSFTANRLGKFQDRSAPVWQVEYFDRIVRDEDDLVQKAHYILNNPQKRWPETEEYPWVGYRIWEE